MVRSGLLQVFLTVCKFGIWCYSVYSNYHAGHLGDTTVEHTAHHLPIIVKQFLAAAEPSALLDPENVSRILSRSMTSFDDAIAADILEIFPGGLSSLSAMSDHEIQTIIYNNLDSQIYKKARLCMYGTTALVALVDPQHQNLWVANLGDSQAGKRAVVFHDQSFTFYAQCTCRWTRQILGRRTR